MKGLAVSLAAAAAHHVTLIFGTVLFAGPVLWVACLDARHGRARASVAAVFSRAVLFAVLVGIGVGIVLLPYWMTLLQHPIHQIPIPHDSRSNFLLNSITGINYFVIPYGALILALPFVVIRGASVPRLRPLLIGFWLTLIFGLGGTTPLPRWLLGRAFEILTFERFTFWATLMVMPIVGVLAVELLDRFQAKAARGALAGSGCHDRRRARMAHGKSVSSDGYDECPPGHRVPQPRWPRFLSLSNAGIRQRTRSSIDLYATPAASTATTTPRGFCPK